MNQVTCNTIKEIVALAIILSIFLGAVFGAIALPLAGLVFLLRMVG